MSCLIIVDTLFLQISFIFYTLHGYDLSFMMYKSIDLGALLVSGQISEVIRQL